MNLFGKKEENKKTEEDSKTRVWLKNAWSDKRGKAGIKLGMYFLFFAVLVVMTRCSTPKYENSNNGNNNQTESESIDYKTMQKNLETAKDFEFIFNITISEQKYNYKGTSVNGVINGYKEYSDGIVKYLIEDNAIFKVLNDEKAQIDNLYEGINKEMLNINYIFTMLFPREYEEEKVTLKNVNYLYESFTLPSGKNYNITVSTNGEYINKIVILEDEDKYELEFVNVK